MLPKSFYNRDPKDVAISLLGCVIVKRDEEILKGKIVETEAYYGLSDPASRAKKAEIMWGEAGRIFIYMVHGNWLFNIITMPKNVASGVLIRAVEPLEGIEIMKRRRRREKLTELTSGPGKFTQAFGIDKRYNGMKIYGKDAPIYIMEKEYEVDIEEDYRIGVREDMDVPLRFYIKDNRFVSKLRHEKRRKIS
ncbi:MAG: DNA-3-methyladenine glycosylase [Thermoplasmata archaeon]|nr:DNA-3-methyladenine glycosylase [Thermoplasmata archaeon]